MLFSSTVFLFLFLPIVLFLYYLAEWKFKNTILLLASLLFYAWGEPKYILIMLVSIVLNYCFALLVDAKRERKTQVKWILALMVASNLAILGLFKYAAFFVTNVNTLLNTQFDIPDIPLPIGISFITFQSISYVIDVYRKHGNVQRNLLNTALYISFFPQLVAGPTVRYQTVAKQLTERFVTIDKFGEGVKRFIMGLAKKMLLANPLGLIADSVFVQDPSSLSTGEAWIGIIAYSLQIYFDFSGYSDMAIGLAKMFGFDFLENFNYPYISKSVAEFWRRWHISLGSWFRDYLYIPLGGNRNGEWNTYRNLFIVWLATGIWHGASWTFIIWGLYYGMFIMMERAFLGKWLTKTPAVLQHIYTLMIVMIGWVFFRSETMEKAWSYIQTLFGLNGTGWWSLQADKHLAESGTLLVLGILVSVPIIKWWRGIMGNNTNRLIYVGSEWLSVVYYLVLFVMSVTYVITNTFNPFIYFNF